MLYVCIKEKFVFHHLSAKGFFCKYNELYINSPFTHVCVISYFSLAIKQLSQLQQQFRLMVMLSDNVLLYSFLLFLRFNDYLCLKLRVFYVINQSNISRIFFIIIM